MEKNGKVAANGGTINLNSGLLTLSDGSVISTDTNLNISEFGILEIGGGIVTIDSDDEIFGVINGKSGTLEVVGRTITDEMFYIADEYNLSVSTIFEDSTIDLTSSEDNWIAKNTNLGNVTINSNDNNVYLKIDVDLKNKEYDTISVMNSQGVIYLSELNGLTPEDIVSAGTDELILVHNWGETPLELAITEELRLYYERIYTVASYLDKISNIYDLTDESFIGRTGIELNKNKNGIYVGILEQFDTLYSVNISDLTPRRLTFSSAKTLIEENNLDVMGSGAFTLNGFNENASDSILDMSKKTAFILEKESEFIVNNLTVQNASMALKITNENASATLNNVVLTNNDIAIENKEGVVNINAVLITEGSEVVSNRVINEASMNLTNTTVNAKLYNDGVLLTSDVDTVENNSNSFSFIENNGTLNLNSSSDNITNLTNTGIILASKDTIIDDLLNSESGSVSVNGKTTFGEVENKGILNVVGNTVITKITNDKTFTSSGDLSVDSFVNNADATTRISSEIEFLNNKASYEGYGNTTVNELENSGTINLNDTSTLGTVTNNKVITATGLTQITDLNNIGESLENIAVATLTGTNAFKGIVYNNAFAQINLYGVSRFESNVSNSGAIISNGDITSVDEFTNLASVSLLKGDDENVVYKSTLNNVSNSGEFNIETNKNIIKTLTNTSDFTVHNTTEFTFITNTGADAENKAVITSVGNTTVKGIVLNNSYGQMSFDGTQIFEDEIKNADNSEFYGIGNTTINGAVTVGNNSNFDLTGTNILNSSVDIGTNSTVNLSNDTVIQGIVSIHKDSILNVQGETNFNDTLTLYADSTVNTGGITNFTSVVNAGTINLYDTNNIYGIMNGSGQVNIFASTNIDGGSLTSDLVVDIKENSTLTLKNGDISLNENDIITGNITAERGDLSIVNNSIVQANLTIADENNSNVNVDINNVTVDLTNNSIKNMNLGVLTSSEDSVYKLDIELLSDSLGNADTISVGAGSSGTITIHELNGLTKDEIHHNDTAIIEVLNRVDSPNSDNKFNINLVLTDDLISLYTRAYTVATYWNEELGIYDVKSDNFIGTTGIALNETLDSILVGILSQDNTLHAVNTAVDTPRRFKFVDTNEYQVTCNLETTGTGIISVEGYSQNAEESVINMNNYSGFVLSNASDLTLKNVTIKNALSENGSVISIEGLNPTLVIDNVVFEANSSTNNGGVLYTKGNSVITSINAGFENNTATQSGGAIYVQSNTIISSIISAFNNNSAQSGGAIYLASDGTTSAYITYLNASFAGNNAVQFGGAIANDTNLSSNVTAYSTIDRLLGSFENNYVQADTSLSISGGAIYNTGMIRTIEAKFITNNLVNTNIASSGFGGAIYNNVIITNISSDFEGNFVKSDTALGGAIYNTGSITSISSSFINNYVEGSTALGGAIYTTSNLTFLADNNSYVISGNYINNNGVHSNQGIYVANSGVSITIQAENNGAYRILDNIESSDNYVLNLRSNTKGMIDLLGVVSNSTVLLNGATLSIAGNTFADSNTNVTANTGVINLKDGIVDEYVFNTIVSTNEVNYNIDLTLDLDSDKNIIVDSDKIITGVGSSGFIKLYDISLNIQSSDLIDVLKDALDPINVVVLNRADNNISITLDDSIMNNPILFTIDNTYNYNVKDTDFIGAIGIDINDNLDGVFIGVVDVQDTLVALNRFDKNPDGERSFNFVSEADTYTINEELGITGAGNVFINVNDKTIDLNTYSGFEVVSELTTNLFINDAILNNGETAILVDTNNENSSVNLSNVTLSNNIMAINNSNGVVNFENVTIEAGHNTQINAVTNAGILNLTSKNSISSSILNTGRITLNGENTFNSGITGNGSGYIYMESGTTDISNSVISDNTFVMNSGVINIGSASFAKSHFVANSGTLSLVDDKYRNYSFDRLTIDKDFEISIDTDFMNEFSDSIYAGAGSSGIITLVELNGFDIEMLKEKKTLKILYRENSNDEIYLSVSPDFIDNNKKEIDMSDYFVDGKYVVSDTDFIGTLSVGLNDARDTLVTNVDQAGSSLAVVNQYSADNRIFNINQDTYKETTDLGVTGQGNMTLNGNGHTADMNSLKGFEILNADTNLNIDNITIVNAYTKENGSVINALNYSNSSVILNDVVIKNNTACGLGGAIYSACNVTVNAVNNDVQFIDNRYNYNATNYTWDNNSIYMANSLNSKVTLNLNAATNKTISIYDGIDFDKTGLILNINDGNNDGMVLLSGNLGTSFTKQLGQLNFNGGTLSLVDGTFNNIFTDKINITKDTSYMFDVDVLNSLSDMIYPSYKYETTSDNKLVLSQDSFNMLSFFSYDDSDIQASVIRLIATNNPANAYLAFANTDDDTVVYNFDNRNYYFTLGIDGTIIISTKTPDNYLHPLVIAIRNTKANTYTMTSNNLLYNYGRYDVNLTQNKLQSTKLTIKGNNYSIISKEELQGIEISGTDKIKPAKQQLVVSDATFKGFNEAIINRGGKVTLTNTNFVDNETDTDGSTVFNELGTVSMTGASRTHSRLYNNRSNYYGGAVYNGGTFSAKYVDFGGITDNTHGSYANIGMYGGAIANFGSATITSSRFDENIADELGGAIYNVSSLKLSSVVFTGNMTNIGGAIYSETTNAKQTLSSSNSTFTSNIARLNGGAIYTTYNYTDSGSTFTSNVAQNGGAIYKAVTDVVKPVIKLTKTKFYGNRAYEYGGAIALNDGTLTLSSVVVGGTSRGFDGNRAANGGGIYNNGITNATSVTFARNTADVSGGAIYNAGTLTLKKTKVGLVDSYGLLYGNNALYGGGLYNIGNANISSSSSFVSNNAVFGGGVYNLYQVAENVQSVLSVGSGVKFDKNTAGFGGAIYNNGAAQIVSATFTNNSALLNDEYVDAGLGGAIYNDNFDISENNAILSVNKSTFTSNTAVVSGGAIYNDGDSAVVTNSTFNTNSARNGGAIYNNGNDLTLTSNKFTSNTSTVSGGAIFNDGTAVSTKDSFTSNSAQMYGGAVYNDENADLNITSGTFNTNTAVVSGGAIYNKGTLDIVSSTFGNTNKKYKYSNNAVSGGAIYNEALATITSSKFYYNTAEMNAAGIYNTGDLVVEQSTFSYNKINAKNGIGGAILNSEGTVTITGTTFSSNSADLGGAVYNLGYMNIASAVSGKKTIKTAFTSNTGVSGGAIYNKGQMDIDNATFTSNNSTDAGGALLLSTSGNPDGSDLPCLSANITNTSFSKNTSKNGGAIYVLGVLEYEGSEPIDNYVTIKNSTFTSNSAKEYGGAIYADRGSHVTIIDTDFKNNKAGTNGGAIFINGGAEVSIIASTKDVTFSGNKAGKANNSIYLNTYEDEKGIFTAILNLIAENNKTIYIKDNIAGNGEVYESGNVVISNRSNVSGITFKPYEGSSSTLIVERESSLQNCSLVLDSNNGLSLSNGRIGTMSLRSLSIADG
ncbi:MAG: hypothetical protein NC200_03390, partial [Candidatus Gastranaerophilales bacterium]|nr:hypothetical protein [Candidatus Gastranaerophilales bacterium]